MRAIAIATFLLFSYKCNSQDCYSCKCLVSKSKTWEVFVGRSGKEFLVRGDSLQIIKNSIPRIIKTFNEENEVHLVFRGIKHKVVFVKITNSEYFTQRMGDAGANWYLASLVFTLTENRGIKSVYVDFEEGDHGGQPGNKTRKDFKDYVICNIK